MERFGCDRSHDQEPPRDLTRPLALIDYLNWDRHGLSPESNLFQGTLMDAAPRQLQLEASHFAERSNRIAKSMTVVSTPACKRSIAEVCLSTCGETFLLRSDVQAWPATATCLASKYWTPSLLNRPPPRAGKKTKPPESIKVLVRQQVHADRLRLHPLAELGDQTDLLRD